MKRLHMLLLGLMLLAPVARGQDGRAWVEPGDEAVIVQGMQGVTGGIALPVSVLGAVAPSAPSTVVGKDADGIAPTANSIPVAGIDPGGNVETLTLGSGAVIALGAAGDAATIATGLMVRPTSSTGGNGGLIVGSYGFDTTGPTWRRTLVDAVGNLFSKITDGTDTALISGSGALFVSDVGGLQLGLESTNATISSNVSALNTNSRTVGTGFMIEGNRADGAAIENPVVIAGKDSSGNRDAILTDDAGAMKVSVKDSALPAGGSTSALQTTGNTSLDRLDEGVTNVFQQGGVASVAGITDGAGNILVIQRSIIEQTTTDPVTIKTAVGGKRLVVTNVSVIGDGNTDITFRTNATPITGDIPVTKNSGFAPGFDPTGHFQAEVGEALVLITGANIHVAGWINWVEAP